MSEGDCLSATSSETDYRCRCEKINRGGICIDDLRAQLRRGYEEKGIPLFVPKGARVYGFGLTSVQHREIARLIEWQEKAERNPPEDTLD